VSKFLITHARTYAKSNGVGCPIKEENKIQHKRKKLSDKKQQELITFLSDKNNVTMRYINFLLFYILHIVLYLTQSLALIRLILKLVNLSII
jgi:hypothetical protein